MRFTLRKMFVAVTLLAGTIAFFQTRGTCELTVRECYNGNMLGLGAATYEPVLGHEFRASLYWRRFVIFSYIFVPGAYDEKGVRIISLEVLNKKLYEEGCEP